MKSCSILLQGLQEAKDIPQKVLNDTQDTRKGKKIGFSSELSLSYNSPVALIFRCVADLFVFGPGYLGNLD